ncbi:toll/interleukin-1 receptor domain-containing protein [Phytohabitans sp. ZYX-F-186]|uniref:Toll/interleukin-1 receptor domain-containing protein n=1 Tax=Phytohabitans maris TaxID=3071409 RepID=A0ABU0ZQ10_9ACTN|nr:toll/interleukin-1 receptor domain-containing protein [Phytohabitans sp. ZYX-F-186]MDQ7909038.1 toll/interleukin-1 receptor domain-containing protein [Phytohabitans sp. ZYX-F-186]
MSDPAASAPAPRVFVSYSWDSEPHKAWVLQLAVRLRRNGIDVVLDRWNARLGANLPLFTEEGVDASDRILVIVTEMYAHKAYEGRGGVSYERRLLTADLMDDLTNDRILTILRDNPDRKIPIFLGQPVYLDFRDDADYETRYAELIHNLHGREILPVPLLGPNPFLSNPPSEVELALRNDPARYVSPNARGSVTFDHSNNDGRYVLGSGDMTFTLKTSNAGKGSVYVYNDPVDIQLVALAAGITEPSQISDASVHDSSSRSRHIRQGDAVVLRNSNGYWAVVCVDEVHTRDSAPSGRPSLSFRYAIQPDRTADFSRL